MAVPGYTSVCVYRGEVRTAIGTKALKAAARCRLGKVQPQQHLKEKSRSAFRNLGQSKSPEIPPHPHSLWPQLPHVMQPSTMRKS